MHLKTFTGLTVKSADLGQVSAVFSTFNVVDHDGDITLPGAIKDGAEVVISAYGHSSHWEKLPVGKGVIRTTDTEAILEGEFFMDTTHGRDTFNTVKGLGPLGEWSYSLQDVTSRQGELDGKQVTYLESIGKIKEVSPVLMGAGINTRTLGTKGADSLHDELVAATAVVDDVVASAERVVALRAEMGKSLSTVNTEALAGVAASMDRLKSLLDSLSAPADEGITPEAMEAVKQARAALLRSTLFSAITV